jgi:hypothetical protein
VKYRTAAAFRTALEARLRAEQRDGVGISRLRKRVVFERLLARLQAVAPGRLVLTGGLALELHLGGWPGQPRSPSGPIRVEAGGLRRQRGRPSPA